MGMFIFKPFLSCYFKCIVMRIQKCPIMVMKQIFCNYILIEGINSASIMGRCWQITGHLQPNTDYFKKAMEQICVCLKDITPLCLMCISLCSQRVTTTMNLIRGETNLTTTRNLAN